MSAPGGHRALLAAYPARLRRKHGAELLETMSEMTGGHPTRAEWGWLLIDGLRERFRPPARRPFALLAAVLALLIGGALGAAAGSRLGTAGYATLPDAGALGQRVLPQRDGDFNGTFSLYAGGSATAGTDLRQALEQVRGKLAAEGWQTGPVASAGLRFTATRAGTELDVSAYGEQEISITGWPGRPASYLPLTIAGTLLGLIAGWLVGVALAHRIRAARRPRWSAVLATAGLVLVIPSATGFVASLLRYLTATSPLGRSELVHTHGFSFGPTIHLLRALDLGEGSWATPSDLQQLPIWGFVLIAGAAILARPRRVHQAMA